MIKRSRTRQRSNGRRRGASLVELAVSLTIFFTLILATIDIGLGLLRNQQLTEATRFLARQAAVRGNLATGLGIWGPATMSGTASDGSPAGELLRTRLAVPDAAAVQFRIDWIDGGNDARDDHRVQVTATYPYRPFFTALFNRSWNFQSVTIVPIAH